MQKAVTIAATLHGGVKDLLWVMDADPSAVDIIFLSCQRKLTAESLGNIPSKDQPTYEELNGYLRTTTENPTNIAWSDRYPELCAWLADYANKQKRTDRESDDVGFSPSGINQGAFDFHR